MSIEEIKTKCVAALETSFKQVILVVPWKVSGLRTRLGKTCGPYGHLLCVNAKGGSVVSFDAQKVLDFFKNNGM